MYKEQIKIPHSNISIIYNEIKNCNEEVLVINSYINYQGKMVLTKNEAVLLLSVLDNFIKS